MTELPVGWEWVTLDDVADLVRGVTFKKSQAVSAEGPGMLPIIRAGNIQDGRLDLERDLVWIPADRVADVQKLRARDIVVATSSGSITVVGKSAPLAADWPGAHGAFLTVVRPTLRLDPQYLAAWLASPHVRDRWSAAAAGTSINNLKVGDLLATPVPVPSRRQQAQIASSIDEYMGRVDTAGLQLDRVRTRVRGLQRATIDLAFDQVSVTQTVPATEVFRFITSGSRGWAKHYATSGDVFIRVGNVPRGSINLDLSDVQHVQPPEGAEGRRTQVEPNDLLITITADVGRVAVVPLDLPRAFINQHVALARPHAHLNSDYLAWFLISSAGQRQLRQMQRGATKAGLGLNDIRALQIPLASEADQERVRLMLRTMHDSLARRDLELLEAGRRASALRRAILQAAFSGRLVAHESSMALTNLAPTDSGQHDLVRLTGAPERRELTS